MAKPRHTKTEKRPARILGVRPWLLLVGGLSLAAARAIAKSKHRRLAAVDKVDAAGRDSSPARDPPSSDTGDEPVED